MRLRLPTWRLLSSFAPGASSPTSLTRGKAFFIHASISAIIAAGLTALMLGVWYPPPYFRAAGASHLEMLLVGVDLTIGPLLTLVVFKPGKPGLKFDLLIIALLQSSALIYGMSVVLATRPVFLVGEVDRFVLVRAEDVAPTDLVRGREPRFRSLSWTGPRLIAAELPSDPDERFDLAISAAQGKDIDSLPKYYVDYSQQVSALLKRAKPLSRLLRSPADASRIQKWLQSHHRSASSIVWLPLTTPDNDLTMLMDSHSGEPLGAIAIDPW